MVKKTGFSKTWVSLPNRHSGLSGIGWMFIEKQPGFSETGESLSPPLLKRIYLSFPLFKGGLRA
ncbi:MAG: hypothetical protein H8E87_06175 [FCB group bacterium]|nr:hypothetical protein [FCB group bacterium]